VTSRGDTGCLENCTGSESSGVVGKCRVGKCRSDGTDNLRDGDGLVEVAVNVEVSAKARRGSSMAAVSEERCIATVFSKGMRQQMQI